jgi:hypothetical protein
MKGEITIKTNMLFFGGQKLIYLLANFDKKRSEIYYNKNPLLY